MPNPSISAVVCTYNRADMVGDAILSVACQKTENRFDYEVIVIDDGSSDNTAEAVRDVSEKCGRAVRYICKENGGVAAARNRGIAEARGRWVAFFDDDQLADPEWLLQLLAVAEAHDARCVGGAIRAELPEEEKHLYGPVRRSMLGEHAFGDQPEVLMGKDVPSSGNLLIERSLFDEVGLFDTERSSGEDTDMMLRIRKAGIPLWSAPEALMLHRTQHHRLKPDYFRWVSFRWGAQFAAIDAHTHGLLFLGACAGARLAKCILICMPLLIAGRLSSNRAAAMDCMCRMWRTKAYLKMALLLCAPSVFRQKRFTDWIDFRKERNIFKDSPV